jgi:predicted transcriptional regulator
MAGCGCSSKGLSDEQKQILEALKNCDKPAGNKDIVEATGLDKKVVSSKVTALKKLGLVDSPARCKYGITGDGINELSKCGLKTV